MQVTLVQANRQRFDGRASQVVLPSSAGEVAVLPFHAPMLCALAPGTVQIDERRIPVRQGIVRVEQNRVTIITES